MAKSGKKLAVAIVVLVIAIALATTATFAWFSMNQTAAVDSIDLNVTSETSGLYVSLNKDSGYNTAVNANMANGAGNAVIGTGIKLSDVTGSVVSDALKIVKNDANNADTRSYAKFPVYFRASLNTTYTVNYVYVNLNTTTSTVTSNGKEMTYWGESSDFTKYYGGTISADKKFTAKSEFATRIAFETGAMSADADSVWTASGAKIWNPKSKMGASTVMNTETQNSTTPSKLGRNLAQDWLAHNVLGQTELPTTVLQEAESNAESEFVDWIKLTKNAENSYYEGMIYVYVYLEGTDSDCFDEILNDALSIGLKFDLKLDTTEKA